MVRRTLKLVLWGIGAVVALGVIAAALVWLTVDARAKATVEASAANAFGQPTNTDRVHVRFRTPGLDVRQMRVANVEGYAAENLLTTDEIDVRVILASLFQETLRVSTVEIENLTLRIEQKGLTSNISHVLGAMTRRADEPPARPGRRLLIDRVVVRNIVADVSLALPADLPLPGVQEGRGNRSVQITIPELVLTDVTPETAGSVATEEVLRRIFPAIVAAVLEQGEGLIPEDLFRLISADLDQTLAALGDEAGRLIRQATDDLAGRVLKEIPEVEEPLRDIGERLRGVLERNDSR